MLFKLIRKLSKAEVQVALSLGAEDTKDYILLHNCHEPEPGKVLCFDDALPTACRAAILFCNSRNHSFWLFEEPKNE